MWSDYERYSLWTISCPYGLGEHLNAERYELCDFVLSDISQSPVAGDFVPFPLPVANTWRPFSTMPGDMDICLAVSANSSFSFAVSRVLELKTHLPDRVRSIRSRTDVAPDSWNLGRQA